MLESRLALALARAWYPRVALRALDPCTARFVPDQSGWVGGLGRDGATGRGAPHCLDRQRHKPGGRKARSGLIDGGHRD